MNDNAEEHVLDRDDKTRGTAYEAQDWNILPGQSYYYKCGIGTGGSTVAAEAGAGAGTQTHTKGLFSHMNRSLSALPHTFAALGAGAGNFADRNSQKAVLQRLRIADMIGAEVCVHV